MDVNFHSLYNNAVSLFNNKISFPLTAQQKKILGIVLLALGCMGMIAGATLFLYDRFKAKPLSDNQNLLDDPSKKVSALSSSSESIFKQTSASKESEKSTSTSDKKVENPPQPKIDWKKLEASSSNQELMETVVGGKEAYEALPELDLSKLTKWVGGTGYPDSFQLEDITAPVMRGINGYPEHKYLIIKFKISGTLGVGAHVFFWSDANTNNVRDCHVHRGKDLAYNAVNKWQIVHTLITTKSVEYEGTKFIL